MDLNCICIIYLKVETKRSDYEWFEISLYSIMLSEVRSSFVQKEKENSEMFIK